MPTSLRAYVTRVRASTFPSVLPIKPRAAVPFNLVIASIEAFEANTRVTTEHPTIYPGQNRQIEAATSLELEYLREYNTCLNSC